MTGRASLLLPLLLAGFAAACSSRTPDAFGAASAAVSPASAAATATGSGHAMSALLPAMDTRSLCAQVPDAFLGARLRGALDADILWRGKALQCAGGLRPDGRGVRAAFAGELPTAAGAAPRRIRFIFGIGLDDRAHGNAQALPTNLTVILEGEETLFTTLGDDRCAADITGRAPLPAPAQRMDRLSVRGYCLVPAEQPGGDERLLVSTFEFTGVIRTGEDP